MSHAAALTVTGLVRSRGVVQQGRPILVRGQSSPGATVHITLGSHTATTQADAVTGCWRCQLPPLPAGGPYAGEVRSDDGQHVALTDIYCGQLWLCAGQSNMAMTLSSLVEEEQPKAAQQESVDGPVVRFVPIPMRVAARPMDTAVIQWDDALDRLNRVSAVGYHFAWALAKRLQMPVGFVQTAVGHTPAMAWTSRARLIDRDFVRQKLEQFEEQLGQQPDAIDNLHACYLRLAPQMKQWNQQMVPWLAMARESFNAGRPYPPMPAYPADLGNAHTPTVLYNGMLAPLAGEAFAGLLWYQGETDAILGYAEHYQQSLSAVVASVRDLLGPLPAVVVELPGHLDIQCDRPQDDWPGVRFAQQRVVMNDASLGLVTTLDLGDAQQIHPTRKRTLAQRAAEIAMWLVYGDHADAEAGHRHGPLLHQAILTPQGIELHFAGAAGRLSLVNLDAPDAAAFEVLRENIWMATRPQVIADTIVLLPGSFSGITKLRYAWAGNPTPIVVDERGWPASGFEVPLHVD